MRKFLIVGTTVGFALILFQNCGGFQSTKNASVSSAAAPTLTTLANTSWISVCDVDTATQQPFTQSLRFVSNGTSMAYVDTLTWYADANCQSITDIDQFARTMTPSSQSTGKMDVLAQVTSQTFTPKTQGGVTDQFNQESGSRLLEWKVVCSDREELIWATIRD